MQNEDVQIGGTTLPSRTVHFEKNSTKSQYIQPLQPSRVPYLTRYTFIQWASNPGEPENIYPTIAPTAIFFADLALFIHPA